MNLKKLLEYNDIKNNNNYNRILKNTMNEKKNQKYERISEFKKKIYKKN